MGMPATDVGEADFQARVIERSYERPVVVDFWAAWCAPCRHLGPLLERIADAHAGDVDLVKVDVDANPSLAAAFGIQGIPAVKAFRDGGVVAEFVGAYPEEAVRNFFDAILPTEADRLAAAGDAARDTDEAERAYRSALEKDFGNRHAVLGLAPLLAARGAYEEARRLLARLPEDADVRRLRAHIDLAEAAGGAAPDDPLAAASADGDWEPVLERLLTEVRTGDHEDARQRMLDVFEVLGPGHPLTVKYRAALAAALF
jgi:putative thioredoxin